MGIFQILSGMRLSLSPRHPPMLVGMKKETVKYHTSFSIDNDLQIQGQDHHRGLESSLTTAGTYIICKTGIRQISANSLYQIIFAQTTLIQYLTSYFQQLWMC